jgi:phosphatidylglycerophosphatase A
MIQFLLNWVRKIGATLFFIGYLPKMPGTWGAAATTGALAFVHYRYPALLDSLSTIEFWLVALGLVVLSIFLSSDAEALFGRSDPSHIVIDEVAGQFITFFMVPLSWETLLLGFLLFRFFDIIKPFPIYKLEVVDGGVGVTADDVAAGVCANVVLLLIVYGYFFIRTWLTA